MTTSQLWHWFDEVAGTWVGPVPLEALDALAAEGRIAPHTDVVSTTMARREGPAPSGIPYSQIARIEIEFQPEAEAFLATRPAAFLTVLAGPNNSGKTLYLRQLLSCLGPNAYLLSCNRFSHVDVLNTRQHDALEHRRYYETFLYNYHTAQQNDESNHLNLQELITALKEDQLDRLFRLVSSLLGQTFSLKQIDAERRFSPYYIDMDGQSLRLASTGTRLLFVILGLLFDRRFSTVLIDEPEIGLSPRVQQALATILTEGQHRSDFFPHLEHVILATHSHLFLDRRAFSNNYVLARTGKEVTVRQIASPSEMHYLQFNMLGNSLEALSLPSAIVVVEGESDQTYLSRLLQLKWPNRRISVVRAGGDGEVLGKIHVLREALGDLPLGPYKDRLFVVLDARNSAKRSRLVAQGLSSDHIVTWSRNGIEYLYPTQGLAHVFRCRTDEVPQIALERDPIEFNGFRHSKKELAQRISEGLSAADVLDAELDAFLAKVEAAIT